MKQDFAEFSECKPWEQKSGKDIILLYVLVF